ncbi:DUF6387 family protein [Thiomicrorhabdus indica]|uniref:DUF6387 family protein n=1 Tax=Thiomicrorhabdus indica TaxID=2267253 RepID=UPI002AA8E0DE|nr:DUF6387 family protein [Thiomicrorhabdus indica]
MDNNKHPKTPDWFNNQKYTNATNFSELDWYKAFYIRTDLWKFVFEQYQQLKDMFDLSDKDLNEFGWIEVLRSITRDPLSLPYELVGDCLIGDGFVSKAIKEANVIKTPTLGRMEAYAKHNINFSQYGKDGRANITAKEYGDALAFAEIDLSAPKEKILKEFKKWLNAELDIVNASKRSFPNEREALISSRILQYIDLKIFFKFEGVAITQEELSSIIFGFEAGADKIRKTVIPKAEQVLSKAYIGWLRHLHYQNGN